MVRLAAVLLVVFIGIMLLLKPVFNVAPSALDDAMGVATGLGAKLSCSGRFVSGLTPEQLQSDLEVYSPAYKLIESKYDETAQSVSTSLFGFGVTTASYRSGLGCTLDKPESELLDSVVVPQLSSQSVDWPKGSGASTIDVTRQERLESLLTEDNTQGWDSRAMAVILNGQLVAEAYAPGISAQTPLLGWSMGKSVTSILIGALERDGLLDPNQRSLFAQWKDDSRANISLENLLQMSSGLVFDEDYAPGSDATYMLSGASSAAEIARDKPLEYAVGEHWSYSSGTTNLLALLFQQALGGGTQQAVSYLYERLFAPLGMAHTILEVDPSGVFVGSSYVYGSARDWARLGQLMLAGGELNGYRLLDTDWVERASRPNNSVNEMRYGYQFWLNSDGKNGELRWPDLPADAYAMLGNRSQVVMIVPSQEMVIVRLGWSADSYPTSERLSKLL